MSQIVSQKSKISILLRTHYVTYELCFKCMGWMCRCAHEAAVFSPQRAVKFLMPIPNLDYKQKCCALKLLPLDKQLLLNKCVLMQKVVHGKASQYLKDLMIPSERLHVHGNKQLLPRTRIDIFKTSFSFSGSLAWNSLAHHLRYPMEVKTFKRKAFQALARPPWILRYTSSSFFYFSSLFFSLFFSSLFLLFFFFLFSLSSFSSSASDSLTRNVYECCYCFPSLALVKF